MVQRDGEHQGGHREGGAGLTVEESNKLVHTGFIYQPQVGDDGAQFLLFERKADTFGLHDNDQNLPQNNLELGGRAWVYT